MAILGRWYRGFVAYFRERPWLTIWIGIFAVCLGILAAAGQIYVQGSGHATIYEWVAVAIYVTTWVGAKFIFKTDLTEEFLLGLIFGIQWEFMTHPYWTYLPDKINVLAWRGEVEAAVAGMAGASRGIPLLVLMGWGFCFGVSLYFSQWLAKHVFKIRDRELVFDWRILLCDAIAVSFVGCGAEWVYGILLGCWKYNVDFGLGKSPLGLGWEIHIGYMIVMFWYGTTFRVWKLKLEGALPIRGAEAPAKGASGPQEGRTT